MTLLLAMRRRVMKVAAAVVSGVTDAFNRANSTTTMGNADTGQAWEPNSGTWGIDANRAYLVSATSQATTVVESGLADGKVEMTLAVASTNGNGLCFRSTDDNNHFLVEHALPQGVIYRRQAGAFTQITASATAYVSGDVMAVVLSGSSMELRRNGVALSSVTDAFQATATRHGLRSNDRPDARFENFSLTAS